MKPLLPLSLAALLAIACAGDAQADYLYVNKKLRSKTVSIRKAVMLPAQVSFAKVGVKGSEGGMEEGERLAASFYSSLTGELTLRGVTVLPNPQEQAKDDATKYAIADLQGRFDSIRLQLRRKPGRVTKGEVTLDDRVAKFEPGATADVLVFMRGEGIISTPGRTAMRIVALGWLGLLMEIEFRGDVTFVDARSGEVLALLKLEKNRHMNRESDRRFSRAFREAFRDLPFPSPAPKGK